MVPVDSAVFVNLTADKSFEGKLVKGNTPRGNIYFLMKEQTTRYVFKEVNYSVQAPPVWQQDRIAKAEDGHYIPAKGYEDYILSKEF
jgi:hypothetical protein